MASKFKKILAVTKAGVAALALLTGFSSFYTLDQTQQAVVTEFGRPVRVVLNPLQKKEESERGAKLRELYQKEGVSVDEGAGLKFKVPYIQQVRRFDRRLLRWNGSPEEIPTKDKKYIWIDTTARWYIENPLTFLRSVGTEEQAQARLDDILDSTTRNAITTRDLIEIVRTDNRTMHIAEPELLESVKVGEIKEGRPKILAEIIDVSQKACSEYGISIYDAGILIKGLTYVDSVKNEVESRMIAERKRIAKKYISEGEGEFNKTMGEKEKEIHKISSDAYRRAREIEGAADATAIKIYADGFSKDPELYRYMTTLEVYQKSLPGEKTRLILGTDNPLLGVIKGDVKKK